jgi:hypothetical protein
MILTFCIAPFVAASDIFTERGSWSGIYVLIDFYDLLTKILADTVQPSLELPATGTQVSFSLRETSSGD